MLSSNCAVCGSKKSRFIREQEASRISRSSVRCYFKGIIMNKIVNKLLLAGDKFMPKMQLRQPAFTYSERINKQTKKQRKNKKIQRNR